MYTYLLRNRAFVLFDNRTLMTVVLSWQLKAITIFNEDVRTKDLIHTECPLSVFLSDFGDITYDTTKVMSQTPGIKYSVDTRS